MYTTNNSQPTADVTARKSRLKKYEGNKIYLKNGQEFEIELFNPTQDDVLAKISLNDKLIPGGGIVLRPGERVFLDRYLDKPEKFLFSTYEVDGKSNAVKKAIANNGKVEITFHKDFQPLINNPIIINNNPSDNWWYNQPNFNYSDGTTSRGFGDNTTFTTNCCNSSSNLDFSMSAGSATMDSLVDDLKDITGEMEKKVKTKSSKSLRKISKKMETGKVEAGSQSDQNLVYVDKSFQTWSFHSVQYQILPQSQKVYTSSEIRAYCPGCGKKTRKSDNFCSGCGTKS